MRIGFGEDIHRTTNGKPLLLGGILIEEGPQLKGHSDADVLLHAITDAILGAAALGDIGTHFPENDETWLNMNSVHFLETAIPSSLRDTFFTDSCCAINANSSAFKPARILPLRIAITAGTTLCFRQNLFIFWANSRLSG